MPRMVNPDSGRYMWCMSIADATRPPAPSADQAPPDSRQVHLRAVDRASADLRRGDFVLLRPDRGPALLLHAAETVTEASLAAMRSLTNQPPAVLITQQRALALGLNETLEDVLWLEPGDGLTPSLARSLADPLQAVDADTLRALPRRSLPADTLSGALAVTRLTKLARLLPAALAAPVDRPLATERLLAQADILSVSAHDVDRYALFAARSLVRVAEAAIPLADAEEVTVVAFRPSDGGLEHLAIVVGHPETDMPALVRLHSECFTGDLLGSLRCDCGDQLRGAIREIARHGSGVLLYLAQEGRGIGLVNKLRAYTLQDGAFDTVDANEMLGYDADERIYLPAAAMLQQLGIGSVRLMTNNPDKVAELSRHGITVAERVAHAFPANGHNEFYLATKRRRSGHLL